MRIRSVHLENIRSYKQAKIRFSDGITLLSGDIGSGKSTILHAIEFALFGIRRGELDGESLLRHGEKSGSVTLSFELGDKLFSVTRSLRRSKSSVVQATGSLSVDGLTEELTANELKARVFELFGYPLSSLAKQKDLLFRYTVYAPQELMKQLLFESEQSRLDTLRLVFGIDRYKHAVSNAEIITRHLRARMRLEKDVIASLNELLSGLSSLEDEILSLEKQVRDLKEQASRLLAEKKVAEESFNRLSKDYELYRDYLQKKTFFETKKSGLLDQISRLSEDISAVSVRDLKQVVDPSTRISKLEEKKDELDEKLSKLLAKKQSLLDQISVLDDKLANISELTTCPTCLQVVSDSHKSEVRKHLETEKASLLERLAKVQSYYDRITSNKNKLLDLLSDAKKQYSDYLEYKQALSYNRREQQRLDTLKKRKSDLESELNLLTPPEKVDFNKAEFDAAKLLFDDKQRQLNDVNLQLARASERLNVLLSEKKRLYDQKRELESRKKRLSDIKQKEWWVSNTFVSVVRAVEKQVFSNIHANFSSLFSEWFNALVEDDTLFAELNDSFTPVITQDGYDVNISSLSGGEKQSVALAYRLALAMVVSKLVDGIRACKLLILDEPTDGFSSSQLARVRDVLRKLSDHQIILVSHEVDVESFADQIIRVHKREHVSEVL